MQMPFKEINFQFADPSKLTSVDELRTALCEANAMLRTMAKSSRTARDAIEFLIGVLDPVIVAHAAGDRDKVARLLDAHIQCTDSRVTQPPVTH